MAAICVAMVNLASGANHVIENISRIRQWSLSSRRCAALNWVAAPGRHSARVRRCGQHHELKTDEPKNVPRDRAGGRRGHPHALGVAEGAAQDRRAHAARACSRCGQAGRRRRHCRGVGPDQDAVAAKRALSRPRRKIFVQTERRGTAHAVLAARKAHCARLRRYSGDVSATRRWCAPETLRELARGTEHGAQRCGARISPGRSGGLWPAADARRRAAGRSVEDRDASEAEKQNRLLQWRPDGARGRQRRSRFSNASAMPMPRANTISAMRLPLPAIWA